MNERESEKAFDREFSSGFGNSLWVTTLVATTFYEEAAFFPSTYKYNCQWGEKTGITAWIKDGTYIFFYRDALMNHK